MEWISVKDRLPEIPKGKHSVSVLVAVFDVCYEELHPGKGYAVMQVIFDVAGFKELTVGGKQEASWEFLCDEVTHWMPLPAPPVR